MRAQRVSPSIYIDDRALSLSELGGLLRTYTGWGMRIVFVEDDNAEPPLVEIREGATRVLVGAGTEVNALLGDGSSTAYRQEH
jgi:hypothetical protein